MDLLDAPEVQSVALPAGVPGSRRPRRMPDAAHGAIDRPRTRHSTVRVRPAAGDRRRARSPRTPARAARRRPLAALDDHPLAWTCSDVEALPVGGRVGVEPRRHRRRPDRVRSMATPERLDVATAGGGRTPAAGPGSRTTTSLRRPSISGRAIPAGTGEIRSTQYEQSRGVSTGTGIIRRRRPRRRAYVAHHVAVGQDVRAADLDDCPYVGLVERPDEVVEHVADPDRLAAGPHPAGRDHDRQPLRQVPQDLERRAARTR